MIEGVKVEPLITRLDERGREAHLFRADEAEAVRFGQVQLTSLFPGAIKAWRRHRVRTDVVACVQGTVRLGLYDARDESPSSGLAIEIFLGPHNPVRVTIPPRVWFGYKGIGTEEALLVVLTDHADSVKVPDEDTWDPHINDIPFDWDRRDG